NTSDWHATPCNGGPAGLLRRPAATDNAAMDAEPKRKRRWYQFSLRTLKIGSFIAAAAIGEIIFLSIPEPPDAVAIQIYAGVTRLSVLVIAIGAQVHRWRRDG